MGELPRTTLLPRLGAVAVVCAMVVVGGAQSSYASIESSYLNILNQERASHGLAPLETNAQLTTVASAWAVRMASAGVLQHNPALTSEVHGWRSLGENVGRGPDLRDLADAFWASAEHRDNILDPDFSQVGIGATVADHRIYIAVEFRQPLREVTWASHIRMTVRTTAHAAPVRAAQSRAHGPSIVRVQRLLVMSVSEFFGVRTSA